MHNYIIILFVILLTIVSSSQRTKQYNTVAKVFSVLEAPAISTSEQKAEFVDSHHWDKFAFTDTMFIGNADITEQPFADFVNLLTHLSPQLIEKFDIT